MNLEIMKKLFDGNGSLNALKLIIGLSIGAMFFTACDSIDDLLESPLGRSLNQVTKEWTVDTIRYVRYDLNGNILSDISQPTGKMTFEKLRPDGSNDPSITYNHGFVFHRYEENKVMKTDTSSWTYDVDADVKLKYIKMVYLDAKTKTYSGGKTIYDVKEISDKQLYLYREEMLVDPKLGSTYGRAKSIMRMHR